ncbi:ECF transporter S component [Spiroplasma sp. TIUS-1]|uniref:hypothetical protein n=1 Tax=Spiroplasma sp. TIUS-1 TaxID=216963 RepID=UPI0013986EA1|nr:hypothetical protein [Spiroplasma sp. TIUS-1]QHX36016.1 ECF transporter S component [Spiroplasma sp. TIUS-1]
MENQNKKNGIEEKQIVANAEEHKIEHEPGMESVDHYHDYHHFTSDGQHDDISSDEFKIRNSFTIRTKAEMIYKISISGVILSLALIATVIDGYGLEVPLTGLFNGVLVPIRIFDISVILIGLAVTGPLFGAVIGFILPWIHFLLHAHSIYTPVIESFAYSIMVIYFWLIFYGLFKNSPFHKDPNHKKDLWKRWMPMPFIVIGGIILFTGVTILILYVNDLSIPSHDHDHFSMLYHGDHGHDHGSESFKDFFEKSKWNILLLIILQFVRFGICYSAFAVVETRAKKINHRYGKYNY